MTHQEAAGRIPGYHDSVAAPLKAQEGQTHPAPGAGTSTCLRQSRQLRATLGALPGTRSLPAEGRPADLIGFGEGESRGPRFLAWSPRQIAEVSVRVLILVGMIWFLVVWTGVAIPTQRYQEYAVDFSAQLKARGGFSLPSSLTSDIPCAPLKLSIHLGRGNQPGPYDVALVQDGVRYAFASGATRIEKLEPVLRVKLDLSQVPAGESQLGIRSTGREWRYYKVILKSAH